MIETLTVDLAHEPEFTLGRLRVSPSRRELIRDDGSRELTEHRVMQVLIVLARAEGGIITRDELAQACWDGRAVTDDAINRVISRLRKLASGIGSSSFEIRTITKLGYRLLDNAAPDGIGEPPVGPVATQPPDEVGHDIARKSGNPATNTNTNILVKRRGLILGAAAGFTALAGGGSLLYRTLRRPAVSPEVQMLMAQARTMVLQASFDGVTQAAGLYRQVIALAPDYADGWGALAYTYSCSAHYREREEAEALRSRARAAVARALQLDDRNGTARTALAILDPWRGNWGKSETMLRDAQRDHPDNEFVAIVHSRVLRMVGRYREAVDVLGALEPSALQPLTYASLITTLWGAGKLEEMERHIDRSASLYPGSVLLWFQRFDLYLFSGRIGAADALLANSEGRPGGISTAVLDANHDLARAFETRAPADIDRAMKIWALQARQGSGSAELAIQFAAALGQVDQAFALADAYYSARGFVVPDATFPDSSIYRLPNEREPETLFQPQASAMRADPRFKRLTEMLGLERYWRESGSRPDFAPQSRA